MDRVTSFDSSGHLEIPDDIRNRHGFEPGSQVHIEDRGNEVVISVNEQSSLSSIESISDLAGILAHGEDPVETLLKERKLDRMREDAKFRSR